MSSSLTDSQTLWQHCYLIYSSHMIHIGVHYNSMTKNFEEKKRKFTHLWTQQFITTNQRAEDVYSVKEYQVYSSTVMWWYQCRKIRGFLRRTMNTVSPNSGNFDNTNIHVQKPDTLSCSMKLEMRNLYCQFFLHVGHNMQS